jgi:agmatinase
VKTSVVVFPFDLFGGGGASAGAILLADAIREMLDDNQRERIATRARAYQDQVKLKEFEFRTLAAYADWRAAGSDAVRQVLKKRDFLVWIGGNHLSALPVYDALASEAEGTLVVQFDAHLDIYNLTDCTPELSHGNFLLHAAGPLPQIANLGHRELLLRPQYVGQHYGHAFSAAELAVDPEPALATLRRICAEARRVFLDFDCDVFDPAYFPAVGHPLPFGLTPTLVLRLLDAVWSDKVVGVSFAEFEPARDRADQSLGTLLWLVEYLLLKRYGG